MERRQKATQGASDSLQTAGTRIDAARTTRIAIWRATLHTTFAHHWFNLLERSVPGSAPALVAKKIFLDQVFASPFLHVFFLPYMALAEGHTMEEAVGRTRENFVKLLQANYCYWPFVHCITFSVIPLRHRVAFVNIAAVFWMATLSALNQTAREADRLGTTG
eukprot:CAMPEP_0172660454 /NCGR_PEP_ID=MMETSP1074-20121228/4075_1 /TAXON_ID=2916 /ORGANISM="Ceratium fusus, Strain PA161109" /LENGTH=162 /DNA_ID=CAMNT_0013476073 /DNA_START=157 /DNA_END=642 /DNA_ORIENTATION=+